MLCGGSFPCHRTICEFRRHHLGDFRHLFLEDVCLAREAGIVRLGTVTVDGTKPGQYEQAQGHELWADADGGEAAGSDPCGEGAA